MGKSQNLEEAMETCQTKVHTSCYLFLYPLLSSFSAFQCSWNIERLGMGVGLGPRVRLAISHTQIEYLSFPVDGPT